MNVTRTSPSSCSISGVWRWRPTLYGVTVSSTATKCLLALGSRPAPDTPDLASMTTSPSSPARASGASARIAAVG